MSTNKDRISQTLDTTLLSTPIQEWRFKDRELLLRIDAAGVKTRLGFNTSEEALLFIHRQRFQYDGFDRSIRIKSARWLVKRGYAGLKPVRSK